MSYVVTPARLDNAPTFLIPCGAENRYFCHKNAQPKQTGPSSKIMAFKTLILHISVQFINVPEDQRDWLAWTFLRQGHRIYYNNCEKLGIKGSPRKVHVFIHCKNDNGNYRISTNSSKYQYIKFCLIFMERDVLLNMYLTYLISTRRKREDSILFY